LTALGAAAISSAQAAAQAQASRERLDSQLQRSTGATAAVVKANEDYVSSMSAVVTFSTSDMRDAQAQLVRSTGSVWQSQELLNLSMDTAAATHKDLTTVSTALSKAYQGNYGSLTKLVPSLTASVKAGASFAEIQKELNKQVAGAAKGEAETAAGQYAIMQKSLKGLQVQIGAGLLPVLQQVLPVVTEFVRAASGHPDAILAVGAAIGVLAAAILAANAALSVYNTVLAVNKAIEESATIQKAVATARTIAYTAAILAQRAVIMAVNAATKAWTIAQIALNIALSANPIGLIIVAVAALTVGIILLYRHSATFRAIVQDAFRTARENVVLLLGPMGLMIKAMQELYDHSALVRTIVNATFAAMLAAIEKVVSAIQDLIGQIGRIHFPSKPSWVPFSMPASSSIAGAGVTPYASGGGGTVVNVTIQGAIDPEATALAVKRVLNRYDRRRGERSLGGIASARNA
jgi:hypothetical protein